MNTGASEHRPRIADRSGYWYGLGSIALVSDLFLISTFSRMEFSSIQEAAALTGVAALGAITGHAFTKASDIDGYHVEEPPFNLPR